MLVLTKNSAIQIKLISEKKYFQKEKENFLVHVSKTFEMLQVCSLDKGNELFSKGNWRECKRKVGLWSLKC